MQVAQVAQTKRHYVSFSAEIVPQTTETLIATMGNLANQGVQEVCLLLSTLGGSVMHGLNVYNVLRSLPFHLVTHNVGNVNSIGNAIFLAGDERYACPHSTFMFHGVAANLDGTPLDEAKLRERLDGVQADQRLIGNIIEERTKLDAEQVRKLFLEARTKDTAYAADVGIIDGVRDVHVGPGDPVLSLVFQR